MKKRIGISIVVVLFILGLTFVTCGYYFKSDIKVLMYHHILPEKDIIGTEWEGNSAVLSLEDFEAHMTYLYENSYTVLSLEEFHTYMESKNRNALPEKAVFITFDDGYKSNFEYAYPVLKAYDFQATIFMITSMLAENTEFYEPNRLQFASRDEMRDHGDVFTYGNHTHNLHRRDDMGIPYVKSKDIEHIQEDIDRSDQILSEYVNEENKAFAYPYGEYTWATQKILKKKNYQLVFSTTPGDINGWTSPYKIPRYVIRKSEDFYTALQ